MIKQGEPLAGLQHLLFASLIYGAIPAITILGGGANNPLLFTAIWGISGVCGITFYLYLYHRKLFDKDNLSQLIHILCNRKKIYQSISPNRTVAPLYKIFNERSIFIPFKDAEILLLAVALSLLNEAVAAVIYESWPILFVLLLRRVTNKEYDFTRRDISLNVLAFIAVAIVIFSDTTSTEGIQITLSWGIGTCLLLLSLVCNLQSVPVLKQGQIFVREIIPKQKIRKQGWGEDTIICAVLFLSTVRRLATSIVALIILVILESQNLFSNYTEGLSIQAWVTSFTGGATIITLGTILQVKGTLLAKNLRIQTVRHLTPAIGVLYLLGLSILSPNSEMFAPFSNILELDWGQFIVGLIGIISINIIINFRTENGKNLYSKLVVIAWIVSAIVSYREWISQTFPLNSLASYLIIFTIVFLAFYISGRMAIAQQNTMPSENSLYEAYMSFFIIFILAISSTGILAT